jgi:hypothetical protein
MTIRSLVPIALLTLAVGASAAPAQTPANTPDPAIADGSLQHNLDAARHRWKATGLRSYRYEIRRQCFCVPQTSVLVVVRNGHPTTFPTGLQSVATVPRLFKVIQGAIDDGVAKLTVTYSTRGVPRSISIDRIAGAADDEVAYTIKRFTPLKQHPR